MIWIKYNFLINTLILSPFKAMNFVYDLWFITQYQMLIIIDPKCVNFDIL